MNSAWFINESSSLIRLVVPNRLTSPFHLSGLTADKLGSYGPAFYMVGGAFAAASLTPCVLHCVRNKEMKKKELLPSNKENTEDAQEFEERSRHDELCLEGPSKATHNCRKPVVPGRELFVSTV